MAEIYQLVKLQDRLNSDQAFRQAFLADPVTALQQEGITLDQNAQQHVRSLAQTVATSPAPTPGSTINPQVNIHVGISVHH